MIVTRFAPSPTGLLHLGHAYAALLASQSAKPGGYFLLRIENIDTERSNLQFEENIYEDLKWLGLDWHGKVYRQSDNTQSYIDALQKLENLNLLYPCFCTRSDIMREIANAPRAPHGPDGYHYPGTCKNLSAEKREENYAEGIDPALRLDLNKTEELIKSDLTFSDKNYGKIIIDLAQFGDVVIARKNKLTSYHLAVTIDDARQGVTLVTRGEDLLPSTHIHRALQELLDLPTPEYHHHKLLVDKSGIRLSKRIKGLTLQSLRKMGKTPEEVIATIEKC